MAVRYSATGQHHSFTTSLPASPFTILCWVFLAVDRNVVSTIWDIEGSGGANGLRTTSDGTTVRLLSGTSNVVGSFAMTPTAWHKFAVSVTGTTATFYHGSWLAGLTSSSGTYANQTAATMFRLGSDASGNWSNIRVAAFKQYSAALSLEEVWNELSCYIPMRTTNLVRWCPFVNTETADYSGNGLTLSGGSGSTTELGPMIPWRTRSGQEYIIPRDPDLGIWYATYNTTTGELVSIGTTPVDPGLTGFADKIYVGDTPPDTSRYVWDTTARDFVLKEGDALIDRVDDMVADPTLAGAWISLEAFGGSAEMRSRIGQLLGSKRYRFGFQPVDLD